MFKNLTIYNHFTATILILSQFPLTGLFQEPNCVPPRIYSHNKKRSLFRTYVWPYHCCILNPPISSHLTQSKSHNSYNIPQGLSSSRSHGLCNFLLLSLYSGHTGVLAFHDTHTYTFSASSAWDYPHFPDTDTACSFTSSSNYLTQVFLPPSTKQQCSIHPTNSHSPSLPSPHS